MTDEDAVKTKKDRKDKKSKTELGTHGEARSISGLLTSILM